MRVSMGPCYRCRKVSKVLVFVMIAAGMWAQEPQSTPPRETSDVANAGSPPEVKPYVLHVYQNLMQIPTVVVTPTTHQFAVGQTLTFDPIKGLAKDNFQISLDRGKLFHPTQMRVEGDDPMMLAIVVDLTNRQSSLLPTFATDLQHTVETGMLPHDHVSLYTLDCALVRRVDNLPAHSEELSTRAFSELRAKRDAKEPPCRRRMALIDAAAVVVSDISERPGRRVVLIVTQGENRKSQFAWPQVKRYAAGHSTAIFGLVPLPELRGQKDERSMASEDPFEALCQMTGGVVMVSANMELRDTLKGFIDIVRQRYILEFPRPSNGVAGQHDIQVTVPKVQAVIRPAGISVPLEDPSIANDPTTVPSATSPAILGDRRPIGKP